MIAPRTITATLKQDTVPAKQAETTKTAPSTGDSAPEYWVTRVVRQMKGCSPAKIDSVIQANLRPRKIRWSQRPDTLEIPGLEGRLPYTTDNLPKCYELGYFNGNPLVHPEIPFRPQGIPSTATTQQIHNANIINSVLLLCFVLLAIIYKLSRQMLSQQAQDFFRPATEKNSFNDPTNTINAATMLLTHVVYGIVCTVLFYIHAQNAFNLFLCHIPLLWLLGIYLGVIMISITLKWCAEAFINWVFFDKTSRHSWRSSYNFLAIVETSLLLPAVTVAIYTGAPSDMLIFIALFVIISFKITLIYRTFQTFSFKIYGILHLLSYLCALEIIPLLAMWVILTGITESLTTIF